MCTVVAFHLYMYILYHQKYIFLPRQCTVLRTCTYMCTVEPPITDTPRYRQPPYNRLATCPDHSVIEIIHFQPPKYEQPLTSRQWTENVPPKDKKLYKYPPTVDRQETTPTKA